MPRPELSAFCVWCGKPFKPSNPGLKRYCCIAHRDEARSYSKWKYKNKKKTKSVRTERQKLIDHTLVKRATNRGKPFSKKEIAMIRDTSNTPTILAFTLKRSKQSIEQKRARLKEKGLK